MSLGTDRRTDVGTNWEDRRLLDGVALIQTLPPRCIQYTCDKNLLSTEWRIRNRLPIEYCGAPVLQPLPLPPVFMSRDRQCVNLSEYDVTRALPDGLQTGYAGIGVNSREICKTSVKPLCCSGPNGSYRSYGSYGGVATRYV